MANSWNQTFNTGYIYYIYADQLGQGLTFVAAEGSNAPSEADILALALYFQNSSAFTNVLLTKATETSQVVSVDLTVESPNFDEPTE